MPATQTFLREAGHGEWCIFLIPLCLFMNSYLDEVNSEDEKAQRILAFCFAIYCLVWTNRHIYKDKTWVKFPLTVFNNTFNSRTHSKLLNNEKKSNELEYDGLSLVDLIVLVIFGLTLGSSCWSAGLTRIGVCFAGLFNIIIEHFFEQFPHSFSFGEGCIILQSVFTYCSWSVFCLTKQIFQELDDKITVEVTTSVVGIERLCLCTLLLIVLLPLLLFCPSWAKSSTYFLLFATTLFSIATYPWMWMYLKGEPMVWVLNYVLSDWKLVWLMVFWVCMAVLATLSLVKLDKNTKPGSAMTGQVLTIIVYISGIWVDREFTRFCSILILALLVIFEYIRAFEFQPLSGKIHSYYMVFTERKRDQSFLMIAHIYLMIGTFAPLWIAPANASSLLLFSGVLSVGISNGAASIVGSRRKRAKLLLHQNSTIDEILASIAGQVTFVIAMVPLFGHDFNIFTAVPVIAAVALLKSVTDQEENIALPLSMYFLLSVVQFH